MDVTQASRIQLNAIRLCGQALLIAEADHARWFVISWSVKSNGSQVFLVLGTHYGSEMALKRDTRDLTAKIYDQSSMSASPAPFYLLLRS